MNLDQGISVSSVAAANRCEESILEMKDIHLSYGQSAVLKGVDLAVRRGEVVVMSDQVVGARARC